MDGVDEEMPSSGMRLRQLLLLLLLGIPLIGMGEGAGRAVGIGTNSDIPESNSSCILRVSNIGHKEQEEETGERIARRIGLGSRAVGADAKFLRAIHRSSSFSFSSSLPLCCCCISKSDVKGGGGGREGRERRR